MAKNKLNIGLTSYDDIFKSDENRSTEEIKRVSLSELKPFEGNPYKVRMDNSMDELVESISTYGVLSPIIARPHADGGYEIISGHRRAKACELAGIENVSIILKDLDDDSTIILLVDCNIYRENVLPSEKAYAYQMKLEAIKRKAGRPAKENSDQIGRNFFGKESREILAEQVGESKNQISRYIRLTNLIDPILDMVDNKQIAMNAAVEISYLGSREQAEVLKAIEAEEVAPSIEQAKKLRRFSENGHLNEDVALSIMQEQKPEKIRIIFKEDRLRKYFPKNYTPKQMDETIEKLLANWARKRSEPER